MYFATAPWRWAAKTCRRPVTCQRTTPRPANLIPQRQYRGPVALRSLEEGDDPQSRDALWQASRQAGNLWWTARSLAEYWADGQR